MKNHHELVEQTARRPLSIGLFIRGMKPRTLLEIVDLLGLDFVIVDAEHEAWDPEALALIAGHAPSAKTKLLVRVATSTYGDVARPLDDGADGVVIPRVESAMEAAAAVQAARHPPSGERGVSLRGRLRATDNGPPLSARLATLDREVEILVQIETRAGVAQADEIAGTAGVSGVLVGLTDLSCSIGRPDEPGHPDVTTLVEKVLEACQAHGRSFGVAGPRELTAEWSRRGASLLVAGIDTELLIATIRSRAADLRAAAQGARS
jgi:4-hydroxy-2-oxoheptanedioate aldolase